MKKNRIGTNKKGEEICKRCSTPVSYSEKFDAYYCEDCNIWLEEKCVDPLCDVCKIRPIRPIKKNKPKSKKKDRSSIEWKTEK